MSRLWVEEDESISGVGPDSYVAPADGLGTYPDQSINPEEELLAPLIRSAGELSSGLPDDSGVLPPAETEAEYMALDDMIAPVPDRSGRSMSVLDGAPSEEAPAAPTEEDRWERRLDGKRVPIAAANFFTKLRNVSDPRGYTSADAARDIENRTRFARGAFDYERQLRNEDRNESQEDIDRARRTSQEDMALARRQTIEGRQDTEWSQGQEERSRAEGLRTNLRTANQITLRQMLSDVDMEGPEAQELVDLVEPEDRNSVENIRLLVQQRSLNSSQEAQRQLQMLLAQLRARPRRGGGGGGRRTPQPGEGDGSSAEWLLHREEYLRALRGDEEYTDEARAGRLRFFRGLAQQADEGPGSGRTNYQNFSGTLEQEIRELEKRNASRPNLRAVANAEGALSSIDRLPEEELDDIARIVTGRGSGGIRGGVEEIAGSFGANTGNPDTEAVLRYVGDLYDALANADFGAAQSNREAARIAGRLRGSGFVANGANMRAWIQQAQTFLESQGQRADAVLGQTPSQPQAQPTERIAVDPSGQRHRPRHPDAQLPAGWRWVE